MIVLRPLMQVVELFQNIDGSRMMRVEWFYRLEDTILTMVDRNGAGKKGGKNMVNSMSEVRKRSRKEGEQEHEVFTRSRFAVEQQSQVRYALCCHNLNGQRDCQKSTVAAAAWSQLPHWAPRVHGNGYKMGTGGQSEQIWLSSDDTSTYTAYQTVCVIERVVRVRQAVPFAFER